MQKIIIDKNGTEIRSIFVNENNEILYDEFVVTESMKIVDMYDRIYLKPKWDYEKQIWIEGATQEEIKEANKPANKEPTETEKLQKQLLETQAIVANLQEQILLNQNGGK